MPATLPYARAAVSGRAVHVRAVPRGLACNCVCQHCGQPLVAKKGAVKEHHFAHYRHNPACSQESWLHAAAKQILAERINAGAGVPIVWRCHCQDTHCAAFGAGHKAVLERAVPGLNIKPDITVCDRETIAGYIEVLVTHAPDYPPELAGAPVAILPINEPDELDKLYSGTVTFRHWHGAPCPDPVCPDCRQRESQGCVYCPYCRQHTAPDNCLDRRIKLVAWQILTPMRRPKQPDTPPRDWNVDSQGNRMWGKVKSAVRRNALILAEMGFVQSRPKPWLFYYRIPGGTIFAHLSSTDVIPIWQCQTPMIFMRYRQPPPDAYEALLRDAIRRVALYLLNQTPAGGRVSFHDSHDYDITAPLQAHDCFDDYNDHREF